MTPLKHLNMGAVAIALGFLTACGTTYQVTEATDAHNAVAAKMFAEERNPTTAKAGKKLSPKQAVRQFNSNRPISRTLNSLTTLISRDNYMKIYEKSFGRIQFRMGRQSSVIQSMLLLLLLFFTRF